MIENNLLSNNTETGLFNLESLYSFGPGYMRKKVYYVSDIHILHHIDNNEDVYEKVKLIVNNLFSEEYIEDIGEMPFSPLTIFAGDISSDFNVTKTFYHEFVKKYMEYLRKKNRCLDTKKIRTKKLPIFVVLGNHELTDFCSVDSAITSFKEFFESEHIHFLNNSSIKIDNFVYSFEIMGGIGFAKNNKDYNCLNLITTTPAMSREEEIAESNKIADIYDINLKRCKEQNMPLIVVTHYPFLDWCEEELSNGICTYFSGHNHNNNSSIHRNDFNQYSDNQIGYKSNNISFKSCTLGLAYNPFFYYEDGCHEITPKDYRQFNIYSGENLSSTKMIEKLVSMPDSHLYMVKKGGFYGFFILDRKGAKICRGGAVKTISKENNIGYYYDCFSNMIGVYASAMLPYRKVQERFSNELKELGLSGKIHGCIVDIDFYNHIMINPFDGKITFYYSPVFGALKEYSSFENLLTDQKSNLKYLNPHISKSYKMIKAKNCFLSSFHNESNDYTKGIEQITIKESLYEVSRRINQLQRLFTNGILREWDDTIIQQIVKRDLSLNDVPLIDITVQNGS